MGNLSFTLYQKLRINQTLYQVLGSTTFRNKSDGKSWTEYKLKNLNSSNIQWLSIDLAYKEYAIYTQETYSAGFYSDEAIMSNGYKKVDGFRAEVIMTEGDTDVSIGDSVEGTEYEDKSEENIISIEQWGDEIEYSKGYYLDADEIRTEGETMNLNNNSYSTNTYSHNSSSLGFDSKKIIKLVIGVFIAITIFSNIKPFLGGISSKKEMTEYIEGSSEYTYETSITSTLKQSEKAKVYKTKLTIDAAVKDIIDGIDGETTDVSTNDEDNSVAILTKNEYCLVYMDEEEQVLVQVNSRLYAYTSDSDPYRCTRRTSRFYRSYYYRRAYTNDSSTYKSYSSAYSGTDSSSYDSTITSSSAYNSYSSSVRQSSVNSRSSSGGSTSSGK